MQRPPGSENDSSVAVDDLRSVVRLLRAIEALMCEGELPDRGALRAFASARYRDIHRAYYHLAWNWLPEEHRRRIEEE